MFIAAIAHDLRTPLFSLRGYLDGLESGLADTPDKRDRYYDEMRAALAKAFGFHTGDKPPTVEELGKLADKLRVEKSRDQASTFAVNARGVFLGAREAARRMSTDGSGGVIVNIISTTGVQVAFPGMAAYVTVPR